MAVYCTVFEKSEILVEKTPIFHTHLCLTCTIP